MTEKRPRRTRGKGRSIKLFCNICNMEVPKQDPDHYTQHAEELNKDKKRLLG